MHSLVYLMNNIAYRRLGFSARLQLDCSQFRPPAKDHAQPSLFDE